jgi:DinB superfamily
MIETPAQYVQRIIGILGDTEPLSVLQATPAKLTALVSGKTAVQLSKRPAPEKWSVAEIVAHLSETEIVIGFRVRLILGSNGTPILGFDQDAWATRYGNVPVSLSLETLRALRQANLALYGSLSADQWEQYGMHSERGKETVAHILKLHAGHDLNHLAQVESLVGTS